MRNYAVITYDEMLRRRAGVDTYHSMGRFRWIQQMLKSSINSDDSQDISPALTTPTSKRPAVTKKVFILLLDHDAFALVRSGEECQARFHPELFGGPGLSICRKLWRSPEIVYEDSDNPNL